MKACSGIKARWWLWAMVVGLLMWIIIIAGAARVAHAGDFHDMWLGQWKAHTAPFPGWEKVTRTLVPELEDDFDGDGQREAYSGLFYGTETCTAQFESVQDEIDHGTRTYEHWQCQKAGEVQVSAAQSRIQRYATLLHELTHARDWLTMDDADRARFANIMGYNPNPEAWSEPLKPGGWRSPEELFAEAGEFCGLSGKQRIADGFFWGPSFYTPSRPKGSGRLDGGVYRWRPTHEQARQVCAMLREGT